MDDRSQNPYLSPSVGAGQMAGPIPYGPQGYVPPYSSPEGLSYAVIVTTVMLMFADLFYAYTLYGQYELFGKLARRQPVSPEMGRESDGMILAGGGVQLVMLLISGIVYLCWVHRAYTNLKSLGMTRTSMSPGMAVGGHFIPFYNLVQPWQVMQELWPGSDPKQVRQPGQYARPQGNPMITVWWLIRVISGLVAYFTAMGMQMEVAQMKMNQATAIGSFGTVQTYTIVLIVCDLGWLVTRLMNIVLVHQISQNQEQRILLVDKMASAPMVATVLAPPSSPTRPNAPMVAKVVAPPPPSSTHTSGPIVAEEVSPEANDSDPWQNWPGQN